MVNLQTTPSHLPRTESTGPTTTTQLDPADPDEPPISNHAHKHSSPWLWTLACILLLLTFSSHHSVDALTTRSFYAPRGLEVAHETLLQRRQADSNTNGSSAVNATAGASHRLSRGISFDIQALLIPVLVLLSGMFAGLTLGYMSLDSTQLCVLAKSGTPEQQRLAKKIAPLRKDGHLLLITLLIANMIANETLPVVSDNVLGGGAQAVVVSTVLVIIFSEIIPQSVCSTYGLQIGAAFARPVQILVYMLYPICWPIAWLLTKILGAHSGIIYRRAELKELVNLHASQEHHGGDLNQDVVTIVGAAIDLQERVVRDAMTKLEMCFMLDIETRLDYETLGRVLASGHSRIPVFEVIVDEHGFERRKILGALLTKQLIMIDPEDGVPLREFPLNPLPVVADNMPLLNILNSFQEGRSHLAIVCPRFQPKVAFAPLPVMTLDDTKEDVTSTIRPEPQTQRSWSSRFWSCGRSGSKSPESASEKGASNKKVQTNSTKPIDQQLLPQNSTTNMTFWSVATDQPPMGIITLEDVLEKLLGEQIYDETDTDERGNMAVHPYVPPEAAEAMRRSTSRNESEKSLVSNEKGQVGGDKTQTGNAVKRWSLSTFRSPSMGRSRAQQQSEIGQGVVTAPSSKMPTRANSRECVANNDAQPAGTNVQSDPANLTVLTERNRTTFEPAADLEHGLTSPLANPLEIISGPISPLLSDAINIERGRRAKLMRAVSGTDLGEKQSGGSHMTRGLSNSSSFKGPATSLMAFPIRNPRRGISREASLARDVTKEKVEDEEEVGSTGHQVESGVNEEKDTEGK